MEEVNIYTSLHSEEVGAHIEFMEMQCFRNGDGVINVSLKVVDSLSKRKVLVKDRKIRGLFADQAFAGRKIFLRGISHVPLGIQSCISFDCNVFAETFLYIKATTDTDPEQIKNHRALFGAMQLMVTTGVVQRSSTRIFDILGHATNLICYLSKKIGAVESYEQMHPSIIPVRYCKLGVCKMATFALKSTVIVSNFVLSRIIG